jgi:hypothetical protein
VNKCVARVVARVWRNWSHGTCSRNSSRTIEGLPLCGTHANEALRWLREGRLATSAGFWWGVKTQRRLTAKRGEGEK